MGMPSGVQALVEKYRKEADYYQSAAFKEMAVRSEFLNPMLRALGWDPDNPGLSAPDREVIQEETLRIDGSGKAPDYALLLERRHVFFLEAKRPGVRLETDRMPAYQIRRYCWNAQLPLGIVTDFEEWAIYDCRAEPEVLDGPTTGRIKYFTFEKLNEEWDYLVGLFSREAVAGGSLAQYAEAHRLPQGTLPVDQAFLRDINSWRASLAKDVAKNNAHLDVVGLNEVVQTLIDRIIFLRIAEARGLEAFGELKSCIDSKDPGVYRRLLGLFRRADDRYNSGLFHFKASRGQYGPPDSRALTLQVTDRILENIIKHLYHPYPYEFSVMPADILGRVYEQFLGATITLDGRRAVVEEKPEVRKAGGVYYTPVPIVDYIVEATLGPLLRGSTPAKVSQLRVLDPACGSGSFLIAAYQYLIDWYTAYYAQTPRNAQRHLERTNSGGQRLKTEERKRILLNSIFGVDIDPQAVEVTKLSLLLKVIEGQSQMELAVGRLLPDLDHNIRCGNSLIDVDLPLPMDISEAERLIYNPFNWEDEFPAVFGQGGFDAVIGNPPYLSIDAVWGRRDPRLAYIKSHYSDIHTDKTDILFYFLAKAVEISKGETGFIVSRSFLEADKARKLRGWLATHSRVREVLDFREAVVFPKVGINTAIIRLTGSRTVKKATFRRYQPKNLPVGYLAGHLKDHSNFTVNEKPLTELGTRSWIATSATQGVLLAKIDAAGTPVGEILHVGQGMQTGANKAFTVQSNETALRKTGAKNGLLMKRARNSDITSFHVREQGPDVLYLEDRKVFSSLPPEVQRHMSRFRRQLEARAAFQRGDCRWWQYTWPLHQEYVRQPRILVPYRSRDNRFAVDDQADFLGLTDTTVMYDKGQPEDLHYFAAILNSPLLTFRFRFIGKLVGGGTYEYFHNTIGQLPIPRSEPGETTHDRLTELGRLIHEEQAALQSTLIPEEQEECRARVSEAQDEIDELVGDLYGLTQAERELVTSTLTES